MTPDEGDVYENPYEPHYAVYEHPYAKWASIEAHLAEVRYPLFPIKCANGMTVLGREASKSKKNTWYYLIRGKDGNVYCQCFNWKANKTCVHLEEYLAANYEADVMAEESALSQDEIDNLALSEDTNEDANIIVRNGNEDLVLRKTEAKLADLSKRFNDLRPLWREFSALFVANVRLSKAEMTDADKIMRDIEECLR